MGRILLRSFAVLVLLIAAGLATFYIVDGHPLPETSAYVQGAQTFAVTEGENGALIFQPEQGTGRGVLIMHGALIKPLSYARTAAFFAERGYTVLLPYGGFGRLSINAIDTAGDDMRRLGLDEWYTIGHSMGGMASLSVIRQNPGLPVRAAALWATSMPTDFSSLALPVLFLWGDTDGLLPRERFESSKSLLPADATYVTVTGANHKDFAMYGHQFFDKEGQLGWEQQIDLANNRTLAFFESAGQ